MEGVDIAMVDQLIRTAILISVCVSLSGCKVGQRVIEHLPPRGAADEVIYATDFE